jgi:hypothetical protein
MVQTRRLQMTTSQILSLARKNLGGAMESSARLCLSDAVSLADSGDLKAAKARALKSLAYSVGVFHKDYQKAAA